MSTNNNRQNRASKINNNTNNSVNNSTPRRSRRRSQRRRRYGRMSFTRLPSAYSSSMDTGARMIQKRNGKTEMVFREIFQVTASADTLDFAIPFTPTKWVNTRASVLASTYTSFRPTRVHISYQPANSTATDGSVAIGTVFDGASLNYVDKALAFQALPATNGGFITAVWKPFGKSLALGTSLRGNLFPLHDVDADDVPFWICLSTSGITANTALGFLTVQAHVSLHNPTNTPSPNVVALNKTLQYSHDAETNKTVLRIPTAQVSGTPVVGKDYFFANNSVLRNTVSGVILRVLQWLRATFKQVDGANYIFDVDNAIGTQSLLGSMIGSSFLDFM